MFIVDIIESSLIFSRNQNLRSLKLVHENVATLLRVKGVHAFLFHIHQVRKSLVECHQHEINLYQKKLKSSNHSDYDWDGLMEAKDNIAQIYLRDEDYSKAIKTLENIFNTNYNFNPDMALTFRMRHYWSRVQYNENGFYSLNENGTLSHSDYANNHDNNFNAFTIDMDYRWRFAPGSDIFIFKCYFFYYLTFCFWIQHVFLTESSPDLSCWQFVWRSWLWFLVCWERPSQYGSNLYRCWEGYLPKCGRKYIIERSDGFALLEKISEFSIHLLLNLYFHLFTRITIRHKSITNILNQIIYPTINNQPNELKTKKLNH